MEPDIINDIRLEKDFKNVTFSKFQKSKARGELLKSIYDCKIENACYWSAEFICAGHYLELWNIIIFYYCKYIHCGNPKFAIYLNMRYDNFVNIINNGYAANILILRNNKKIRKMFAEMICMLCYCCKKHTYQDIKLNKNEEFDLINISARFKAPNVNYVNCIFKENDPKELFIPLNEMIYNLDIGNVIEACYWYEWIVEYENICKKKKKNCVGEARMYAPNKNQYDIIWIIWDAIFYYSNPENKKLDENFSYQKIELINKIIHSLYTLFSIKYNSACNRKRKFIIYYCFSLLIDNFNLDILITTKSDEINAIVQKIDSVYKDIKKNEQTPNTDYLFTNMKKTSAEKSIEKIEFINSL
jgi:hypothetical protein